MVLSFQTRVDLLQGIHLPTVLSFYLAQSLIFKHFSVVITYFKLVFFNLFLTVTLSTLFPSCAPPPPLLGPSPLAEKHYFK